MTVEYVHLHGTRDTLCRGAVQPAAALVYVPSPEPAAVWLALEHASVPQAPAHRAVAAPGSDALDTTLALLFPQLPEGVDMSDVRRAGLPPPDADAALLDCVERFQGPLHTLGITLAFWTYAHAHPMCQLSSAPSVHMDMATGSAAGPCPTPAACAVTPPTLLHLHAATACMMVALHGANPAGANLGVEPPAMEADVHRRHPEDAQAFSALLSAMRCVWEVSTLCGGPLPALPQRFVLSETLFHTVCAKVRADPEQPVGVTDAVWDDVCGLMTAIRRAARDADAAHFNLQTKVSGGTRGRTRWSNVIRVEDKVWEWLTAAPESLLPDDAAVTRVAAAVPESASFSVALFSLPHREGPDTIRDAVLSTLLRHGVHGDVVVRTTPGADDKDVVDAVRIDLESVDAAERVAGWGATVMRPSKFHPHAGPTREWTSVRTARVGDTPSVIARRFAAGAAHVRHLLLYGVTPACPRQHLQAWLQSVLLARDGAGVSVQAITAQNRGGSVAAASVTVPAGAAGRIGAQLQGRFVPGYAAFPLRVAAEKLRCRVGSCPGLAAATCNVCSAPVACGHQHLSMHLKTHPCKHGTRCWKLETGECRFGHGPLRA